MNYKKEIEYLVNIKRGLTIQFKTKKQKVPESIMDFSSRTTSKIIERLLEDDPIFGCCVCGWNETLGDIHHINGRKIDKPNHHKNLCYLCPNCHRKIHRGLLSKNELVNLKTQIGDKWKKYSFSSYLKRSSRINYRKEIIKINKKIRKLKENQILNELKNSNIDFTKFGWVKKASLIIGVKDQVVNRWLKRIDPKFYSGCFVRKKIKNFVVVMDRVTSLREVPHLS